MLNFIVSEVLSQALIHVMYLFCVVLCKAKCRNGAASGVGCFQQFNCVVL